MAQAKVNNISIQYGSRVEICHFFIDPEPYDENYD